MNATNGGRGNVFPVLGKKNIANVANADDDDMGKKILKKKKKKKERR